MEFYLTYQGPLKSNARPQEKHRIREYFRPQLDKLWQILPLKDFRDLISLSPEAGKTNLVKKIEGKPFAALVSSIIHMMCSVDITLLWPDEPGNIIKNSGDIDNRLKTLFDALSFPSSEQIKTLANLSESELFHCLLEDDKLISSVTVKTGMFLKCDDTETANSEVTLNEARDISDKSKNVLAVIKVKTSPIRSTWDNIGLG